MTSYTFEIPISESTVISDKICVGNVEFFIEATIKSNTLRLYLLSYNDYDNIKFTVSIQIMNGPSSHRGSFSSGMTDMQNKKHGTVAGFHSIYLNGFKLNDDTIVIKFSDFKIFKNVECECKKEYNPNFSDMAVVVENKKIPVHRFIMANISPYFNKLLENSHNSKNNDTEIIIDTFTYESVFEIINWIYTQKLNENFTEANVNEMIIIAYKFELNRLIQILEKHMINSLGNDNYNDFLKISMQLNLDNLFKTAMIYISKNKKEIKIDNTDDMDVSNRILKFFTLTENNK